MRDNVDIIIMSKPLAQSRPRFTKDGRVYSNATPALKSYKKAIISKAAGHALPDGPLGVIAVFGMPIKDQRRHFMISACRPDIDNLIKPCLDSMQPCKAAKGQAMPISDDGAIGVMLQFKIYVPADKGFARLIIANVSSISDAADLIREALHVDGVIGKLEQLSKSNSK